MSLRSLRNQAAKIRARLDPGLEYATTVVVDAEGQVTNCSTNLGRSLRGAEAQRMAEVSGPYSALWLYGVDGDMALGLKPDPDLVQRAKLKLEGHPGNEVAEETVGVQKNA
jgi:hypothetical protein